MPTTSAFGTVVTGCNGTTPTESNKVPAKSKSRRLGSGEHSITVSASGLGCMGMSYHRSFVPDRKAMVDLIHKAHAVQPLTQTMITGRLYRAINLVPLLPIDL